MEMMNRAIEGASDFRGMMLKIEQQTTAIRRKTIEQLASFEDQSQNSLEIVKGYDSGRLNGENRAEHRARIKRERRESKGRKVAV